MIREPLVSALTEMARAHRIEAALDLMLGAARECIYIFYTDVGDPMGIGTSRLGGEPDLPRSVEWPKGVRVGAEDCLANLIAQIRLSDLPQLRDFPLPTAGYFWIFMNSYPDVGPEVGITALLEPNESVELERRSPLGDIEWVLGHRLGVAGFKFELGFSLPFGSIAFREALEERIVQSGLWWREVSEAIRPRDPDGQIGGFTYSYDGEDFARTMGLHRVGRLDLAGRHHWNSLAELEKSMARVPAYIRNDEELARWKSSFDPLRPGVEWIEQHFDEISSWRPLIELGTSIQADFCLGDSWPLQAFIRSEDLAAGEFSHLAATASP